MARNAERRPESQRGAEGTNGKRCRAKLASRPADHKPDIAARLARLARQLLLFGFIAGAASAAVAVALALGWSP
jgi:hypothetical protein